MAEDEGDLPERVEVEDARMAIAKREALVIDVRDADDFATERIFGSIHADADAESITEAIGAQDDDGPDTVLLVCGDGSRSAELADELRDGDRAVSSLEGGFGAWTGEHLPTAPGRDEEYKGPDVKVPGAVAASTEGEDDGDEDEPDEDDPGDDEGDRRADPRG
jgi:rhodanese-related sulfurtransferase